MGVGVLGCWGVGVLGVGCWVLGVGCWVLGVGRPEAGLFQSQIKTFLKISAFGDPTLGLVTKVCASLAPQRLVKSPTAVCLDALVANQKVYALLMARKA